MEMSARVDVLVEEVITFGDSLWFVQRADRKLAVVRWGFDVDPLAPDAQEALGKARWFDKDMIAGALVTANVRPLVDPDKLLSFYGACAVALGLVEHEGIQEEKARVKALKAANLDLLNSLKTMTPGKQAAATARRVIHRSALL